MKEINEKELNPVSGILMLIIIILRTASDRC